MARHNKIIWTDKMLEHLKENYALTKNSILAKHFSCSKRLVIYKAKELELNKDPEFRSKLNINTAGIKPWNKGLSYSAIGSRAFLFKPGQAPDDIRTNPEIMQRAKNTRNETIRKERLRIKYNLPQKTKLKLNLHA